MIFIFGVYEILFLIIFWASGKQVFEPNIHIIYLLQVIGKMLPVFHFFQKKNRATRKCLSIRSIF
jgi:hypothetical protein